MKKWWIGAAVAVVIVIAVLPLTAGVYVAHLYTTEKLYGALGLDKLGAGFGNSIKVISFERGLFGAKGVVALDTGYGTPDLTIEQEFHYGWFLSDQFPYIAMIKTDDSLHIAADEYDDFGNDILPNGVLLNGSSTILPYISASAHYSSVAINQQDIGVIVEPITLDAAYSAATSSVSLRFNVPLVDTPTLYLEDMRVIVDGAYPLQTVRAESYSNIMIKAIKSDDFELSNLSLTATDTLKPNALDTHIVMTVSSVKAEKHLLNSIKLNVDAIDQDFETLEQLVDIAQNMDSSHPQTAYNTLAPLIVQLFDRGAHIAFSGAYNFDTYPSDFTVKISTDPAAQFDLNFIPSLLNKFIVEATATFDLRLVTAVSGVYEANAIKQLVEGGYIQEIKPNTFSANFQLKNGATSLGGKPFPPRGY